MLLTAIAFGYRPDGMAIGWVLQGISWCAQFAGHGFAERRAPALLDNLLGGTRLFYPRLLYLLLMVSVHVARVPVTVDSPRPCSVLRETRDSVNARLKAEIEQGNQERNRGGNGED